MTAPKSKRRSDSPAGNHKRTPDAARVARVRASVLGVFLEEWEQAHGPFTDEELKKAHLDLSVKGR